MIPILPRAPLAARTSFPSSLSRSIHFISSSLHRFLAPLLHRPISYPFLPFFPYLLFITGSKQSRARVKGYYGRRVLRSKGSQDHHFLYPSFHLRSSFFILRSSWIRIPSSIRSPFLFFLGGQLGQLGSSFFLVSFFLVLFFFWLFGNFSGNLFRLFGNIRLSFDRIFLGLFVFLGMGLRAVCALANSPTAQHGTSAIERTRVAVAAAA